MTGKDHDWVTVRKNVSKQLAGFPRLWKCSRCGRSTWWTSRPAKDSFKGLGCDESLVEGVQDS
ncbi:MAG: hypothetical protein BWY99_02111 [Synergistetes bacterium ADurb.BinA166]|nr:MAG: hypothetical protein BWY99_02111 [Synergistetes bacterium ADurb.BinA166]